MITSAEDTGRCWHGRPSSRCWHDWWSPTGGTSGRMSVATTAAEGRQAARHWREPLGRAGIAARGVLYLILGILAIQFARGETSSDEVSQTGAFAKVAEQPFGKFLLVVLILGLIALALWRFIQAAVGDPVEGDEAKDRVEYLGKGIL